MLYLTIHMVGYSIFFRTTLTLTISERVGWETLYVTGRSGFTSEIVEGLNKSGENFLTGSYDENGVYLFWVTEHFALARLKVMLGSKMIFRYRLRFFSDIGTFTLFKQKNLKNNLTPEQEQTFRDFNQVPE